MLCQSHDTKHNVKDSFWEVNFFFSFYETVYQSILVLSLVIYRTVTQVDWKKKGNGLILWPFVLQWVPEITHHCPKTPFLLVGTQIDLRDDPSTIEKLAKNKQKPITPETAEKLARDLKAVKYVECSALTQVSEAVMKPYVHEWISSSL